MNKPAYESFPALLKAVKDHARNQGLMSDQVIQSFFISRYLHRVFIMAPFEIVLKGGFSMLARIPDARATRDIDFSLSADRDLIEGISLLRDAGLLDEGDYLQFELISATIVTGQDISKTHAGRRVLFDVYGDGNRVGKISVDLVAGCGITDDPIAMSPRNVVRIPNLSQADYRLYPIVDQIADKLCAIFERHGVIESSRQKDLVDLVIIALNEQPSASKLKVAIDSELSRRLLSKPSAFAVPISWVAYNKKNELYVPAKYREIEDSVSLVATMLDPILSGAVIRGIWDKDALAWEKE